MKVIHISPSYFDSSSIIGGGERYTYELAYNMAEKVCTKLISFSDKRISYKKGNLSIEIYPIICLIKGKKINPLSLFFLKDLIDADVVHIHQVYTFVSDIACLFARTLGKKVFVTDHGGGGDFVLSNKLPVFKSYTKVFAQSEFAIKPLDTKLKEKAIAIKGGINLDRFNPGCVPVHKENVVLCVGRLLPHKGINYVIEAFKELNLTGFKLLIIGKVYHQEYYSLLKELASNLPVIFVHNATDEDLLHYYRISKVNILASVHTNIYNQYTPIPELMGLTLLESQACGTPVICTDAGAMSEFVLNDKTGFIVHQNSVQCLKDAMCHILTKSDKDYKEMQHNCLEWIRQFDWHNVSSQLLKNYENSN